MDFVWVEGFEYRTSGRRGRKSYAEDAKKKYKSKTKI
jgi:hypothetical protein